MEMSDTGPICFLVTDMIELPYQVSEHGTWFEIPSLVTDFKSFYK